jgi:hypothetical protein
MLMSSSPTNTEQIPAAKAREKLFKLNFALLFVIMGLLFFAGNLTQTSGLSLEEIPVLYGVSFAFASFEVIVFAWVYVISLNHPLEPFSAASTEERAQDNRSVNEYLCLYFWRINGLGALLWMICLAAELNTSSPMSYRSTMWGSALAVSAPVALISHYLEALYSRQREQGNPDFLPQDARVNLFVIISVSGLAGLLLLFLSNLPTDDTLKKIVMMTCVAAFATLAVLIYLIQKRWRTQKPHIEGGIDLVVSASIPDDYTIGDDGEISDPDSTDKHTKQPH